MAIIITLIVILSIWVLSVIVTTINILYLKHKINKRKYMVYSNIIQQYDIGEVVLKILSDKKNIAERFENIELLRKNRTIESKIIQDHKNNMVIRNNNILNLAKQLNVENDKISLLQVSLEEFNKEYRKQIVLINQDISSYNYWIKFFPYRIISFLFRIKKIDNIN